MCIDTTFPLYQKYMKYLFKMLQKSTLKVISIKSLIFNIIKFYLKSKHKIFKIKIT